MMWLISSLRRLGQQIVTLICRLRHTSRMRAKGAAKVIDLLQQISITPHDEHIYEIALRHSSRTRVTAEGEKENNERLEFLGDAVLDTIICDYLYHTHPSWDEGNLSKLKGSMVSRPVNNEVGRRLHLERYLISAPGAIEYSADIYGNTIEALIGAIYLDQGLEGARCFVLRYVIPTYLDMQERIEQSIQNYKSELLEWVQKHHLTAEFVLDFHELHPNERFVYTVWINGKPVGTGEGSSKKRAQQSAACSTLDRLRRAHAELISKH